ncbi:type II secretion system F family protein [Tahibacter sp. P2K]|uniref:Type II secretion system F family protein n=1 Tax=Tahibacter harae TaxID=2963937 RepID=A0ABT1QQ31_9GAMM|nr:type II secretion system F family protein [Tahibacter harae]MCQ4164404.1 type II secretion system F family protein [Tahibacter harae]
METFVWSGKDKRGQSMKGEYAAKNISLVKAELRRQGISPTSVKAKPKPLFGAAGKKITPREIAVFSRQISVMMQAGVPLVQGLDIIAGGQANVRMKNMLTAIKTDIEGGSTLYEALGKFPVQFDELFVNLVKAGEAAGVLDTVLDTVATYKENIESLKGKIRKAMFYPAIVFAVALLVSAILLIFVVPQFESVFKNFGADLPAFTQMIVSASRFTTAYWYIVLLGTIAFFAAFIFAYKRSPAFAHFCARAVLKLPVIGQILHQSAIARFARTLGVTFRAGVPLVEALDSVAGATGSPIYNAAVKRIREDVAIGHQLQLAMRQAQLFPNMVVQMVAIGEESGALDKMLFKIAEFYEEEVNNAVDALASLLEPFIMVIIGTMVGGMVIGMYLPIFKLAAVVG